MTTILVLHDFYNMWNIIYNIMYGILQIIGFYGGLTCFFSQQAQLKQLQHCLPLQQYIIKG